METLLLNPNSAAQNPVSQQGGSAIDSDGSGDFAPVMDKAVTTRGNMNGQQDTGSGDGAEQSAANLSADADALLEGNEANASILSGEPVLNSAETLFAKQVSGSTKTQSNSLQPQALTVSGTGEEKSATLFTQESPFPVNPPGTENALTSTAKAETLLLQQIQQILDQGKNNGSINITGSNSSLTDTKNTINNLQNLSNPLLAESQNGEIQSKQVGTVISAAELQNGEIQSRQVGIALTTTEETTIATQKSAKLEGAHQDVNEQFFNAKLGDSKTSNGGNFQQNNSEQKGTEQQNKSDLQTAAGQLSGSSISDSKPGESGFSQQLNMSSSTTTQSTGVEGKLAPGATLLVPEKEMVDNLIQRFNVNPRLQTSKLTMQLHPAELGALKIDLLVKGDSIKANIVAQSQQVLETLEKQMPRLRTVLQDQGFTVDSFEISMEGDGGKQKELFQEHFSSQQQEFSSNGSPSQKSESFDALLDSQNETDEDTSGVNLTV